jgi:hypothetical protein
VSRLAHLFLCSKLDDGHQRTKGLLVHHLHVLRDIQQHSGLEMETRQRGVLLAADDSLGALSDYSDMSQVSEKANEPYLRR